MAPMTFTNTAIHKTMAGDLNIGPISDFKNSPITKQMP